MECTHIIINLLKDAYAMEEAIIEVLEEHASDTDDIDLRTRIEAKVENVNIQAEKIKERVEELDDEISTARTGLANIIKNMEGYPTGFEKGKVIKDAIIEIGMEAFQKGTFRAILAAAEECKDDKTRELCETFLDNEKENNEMLEQNLTAIIVEYINRETFEQRRDHYTGEDEIL